MEKTKKL